MFWVGSSACERAGRVNSVKLRYFIEEMFNSLEIRVYKRKKNGLIKYGYFKVEYSIFKADIVKVRC